MTAAAVPDAHAQGKPSVDQGVVQSVASTSIVLRALDGSTLTFIIGNRARVLLNGSRAPLSAIRPGFVAEVTHRGTGRALRVRAFGRFASREQGVVLSVSRLALVLERAEGDRISIPLTRGTRVRRGSAFVGRWAVRTGRRVAVVLRADGSARVVILPRRTG